MRKGFLAAAVSLLLLLSLLLPAPRTQAADDPLLPEDITREGVTLSKTAERTGADTWRVTLTVTPERVLAVDPMEVVLVLDTSGSMGWCTVSSHRHDLSRCEDRNQPGVTTRQAAVAKAAAQLVDSLAACGAPVKLAIVTFDAKAAVRQSLTALTEDSAAAIKAKLPTRPSNSGTNIEDGVKTGGTLFSASGANQSMILISDGEATRGGSALDDAATLKARGIAVYTIGFMISGTELPQMATDAKHYFSVTDAVTLEKTYSDIAAALAAGVTDPAGANFDFSKEAASIHFTSGNITCSSSVLEDVLTVTPASSIAAGNTLRISYTLQLDWDKALPGITDLAPLNGDATLRFAAGSGKADLLFPLPRAHYEIGQLLVNYSLLNADGAEVKCGNLSALAPMITDFAPETWSVNAPETMTEQGVDYILALKDTVYESKDAEKALTFDKTKAAQQLSALPGTHTLTYVYHRADTGPSPSPSASPTSIPKPTAKPTPKPTGAPSPTLKPSPKPTGVPSPTLAPGVPTPVPTPRPAIPASPVPVTPDIPATGGGLSAIPYLLLTTAAGLASHLTLRRKQLKRSKR